MLAWSFTDGTHSLNSSDSTIFLATYNAADPFHHWNLDIVGLGIEFFSEFDSVPEYAVDSVTVNGTVFGIEGGNHGTWTDPVTTAEPATGLLVGLSLAVAGLMRRRKKMPLDKAHWEQLG